MAVFLGPRQTMAEEREGRRRAREIAWREPIGVGPPSSSDADAFSACGMFASAAAARLSVSAVFPPLEVRTAVGNGGSTWLLCTSHGSHPPGACVIVALSRPRRRGIDGPVRSISSIPTDLPARERDSASCVVIEDLPTPPLPERTCMDC